MKNQFAGQNVDAGNGYVTAMEDVDEQFPKCKHHPEFGARIAHTAEQEAVMGEGWYDSPADFPPVPEKPQGAVDGCPGCEALTAQFTEAWLEITEENRRLVVENAELRKAAAETTNDHARLVAENAELRKAAAETTNDHARLVAENAELSKTPEPPAEPESDKKKKKSIGQA